MTNKEKVLSLFPKANLEKSDKIKFAPFAIYETTDENAKRLGWSYSTAADAWYHAYTTNSNAIDKYLNSKPNAQECDATD